MYGLVDEVKKTTVKRLQKNEFSYYIFWIINLVLQHVNRSLHSPEIGSKTGMFGTTCLPQINTARLASSK